ncbi:MAG TPA: hypothetical protein VN947_02395 [Polyangia bacterium]|nr:hypothetical protein [Polyangia bacterium]
MPRSALVLLALSVFATPALAAPAGSHSLRSTAPISPNAATTACGSGVTPKLVPGKGPLIQHVKVFDVFYNQGNQFKDMLAAYYTAITQSAYFDWLTEYTIANYKIGRGSFLGTYEDTNSATTAKTLSDSQVQTYLSGLIDAGKIPAPDDDTMYMIYFPTPISITLQGSNSCQKGGFCAYHSSYSHNNQRVRYGVMPDQAAGGCATGCGPGNAFQNTTDVSSHELIEAVTDPDNFTGWYDDNCGEIGDICAIGQGETDVVNNYTVQKEWSNKNNNCIATDPNVMVNDFTVAASPAMVQVPVGGSATTTVKLTKTAGSAENATLTATAPTGLTASFTPTSVTSDNGMSTLTIMASSMATVGMTQTVTVKATGMSASPTADVSVMIVAAPDMAMSGPSGGGSGGTGGGGSGGTGGGGSGGGDGTGTGTGGNGTGGNGGSSGGNGNHGGDSGCAMSGGGIAGSWAFAGFVLLALAFRRRRDA